jgi:hypothetical protein
VTSVRQAVDGRLVGWRGLPDRFDERALRQAVRAAWSRAERRGERGGRSFVILTADRAGRAEGLEAWVPVGDSVLSSLEYRPAPGLDHAAILSDLGEPELVLSSRHYAPDGLVSDHVHAGRGITVAVCEPLPASEPSGEPPAIVFVQLYRSTSATEFVTRIGQSGVEPHPYPL